MSIFSNFKINSLRKKIEGRYEDRLERMALSMRDLPDEQGKSLATMGMLLIEATGYAKVMTHELFRPDSGVFRNDVNNLNEDNFDRLYQMVVIWYTWGKIPKNSEGGEDQEDINFCINSLEIGLGINSLVTNSYYSGLIKNPNLVNFALYRWCMLAVGHIDGYYETMHENSPDCKLFIEISNLSIEESKKH